MCGETIGKCTDEVRDWLVAWFKRFGWKEGRNRMLQIGAANQLVTEAGLIRQA